MFHPFPLCKVGSLTSVHRLPHHQIAKLYGYKNSVDNKKFDFKYAYLSEEELIVVRSIGYQSTFYQSKVYQLITTNSEYYLTITLMI